MPAVNILTPAYELLSTQLWYRTLATIEWFLQGGTPEPSTAPSSSATKLPSELVGMIVSYIIYDVRSLLACSMTCRSWYTASTPHLHHTLTTENDDSRPRYGKHSWPKPLQESYKLGLLSFVKRFQIRLGKSDKFTPEWLCGRTLSYFSALTNIQELGIDYLQVSKFMPNIRRCFGPLSPTLRFLALKKPSGSCRQILYFIGLFPNLQDLKIDYCVSEDEEENTADATLVPLSVPPLRGRLTLTCFRREKLVREMIALFGGLRFCCIDLFRVGCVQLLLSACSKTLETLRLYPNDEDAAQDFNLSRNNSLRTLETTVESIVHITSASDFLGTVLSSITHPVLLNVVIVYSEPDFGDMAHGFFCTMRPPPCYSHYLWISLNSAQRSQRQFKVFREIHHVRDFRLVLCVDVFDRILEPAIKMLEGVVKEEMEKGGLDYLPCEPLIISERRAPRNRHTDPNEAWPQHMPVPPSAL